MRHSIPTGSVHRKLRLELLGERSANSIRPFNDTVVDFEGCKPIERDTKFVYFPARMLHLVP